MTVAGFTSTGSKRPDALFGPAHGGAPMRMTRSAGCIVHGSDGREYVDFIMALGAVALGYGHPAVTRAVVEAAERGAIGPLAPEDEAALAAELAAAIPWLEQVRLFKTGAEAVAAAVRIARVATGRDRVLGCGYHGWLDWCSDARGVPVAVQRLYGTVPFNDPERTRAAIRATGDQLACVVVEPVVEAAPDPEWLAVLRAETARTGALLVFDEIKTAFRIAIGGAAERWGVLPDLQVLGKALANGFPLAVVGGPASVMDRVRETWISSTMATEFVAIAAARATLRVMRAEDTPQHLSRIGDRLLHGLRTLAARHSAVISAAGGVSQMCYLRFADDAVSHRTAVACAERGVLWKRSAYNFVSAAHDAATVDHALRVLDDALDAARAG